MLRPAFFKTLAASLYRVDFPMAKKLINCVGVLAAWIEYVADKWQIWGRISYVNADWKGGPLLVP